MADKTRLEADERSDWHVLGISLGLMGDWANAGES